MKKVFKGSVDLPFVFHIKKALFFFSMALSISSDIITAKREIIPFYRSATSG
jgi:hypothetical protein